MESEGHVQIVMVGRFVIVGRFVGINLSLIYVLEIHGAPDSIYSHACADSHKSLRLGLRDHIA